jgi:hypothetical protein
MNQTGPEFVKKSEATMNKIFTFILLTALSSILYACGGGRTAFDTSNSISSKSTSTLANSTSGSTSAAVIISGQ